MAQVQTQSFTTMLQNFAATVQGACSQVVNFAIGTVFRALGEACAAIGLWLQGMILQMLALTRASTSVGTDLDTWLADYGFSRLDPIAATGLVAFARFTPSSQAVVPVGAIVQTGDGSQQFAVELDTTNAAYNAALNGFVLAPGVVSINCMVVSITPGNNSVNLPDSSGNVVAGAISQLTQAIPGVDTVTNIAPFQNGQDAESDTAALIRFQAWLQSLSKATAQAIGNAIKSLNAAYVYTLTQNQNYAGAVQLGYFYVVIDDGTGAPSSQVIGAVNNAVDAVRGESIQFNVYPPTVENASVSMTITSAAGFTHATVTAAVTAALQSYINSLPLGTTLNYSMLATTAYTVSGVANVTNTLLNGGTADLIATNQQVIKASTVTVI